MNEGGTKPRCRPYRLNGLFDQLGEHRVRNIRAPTPRIENNHASTQRWIWGFVSWIISKETHKGTGRFFVYSFSHNSVASCRRGVTNLDSLAPLPAFFSQNHRCGVAVRRVVARNLFPQNTVASLLFPPISLCVPSCLCVCLSPEARFISAQGDAFFFSK